MTVLPDGFALASFFSHWFKEHLSRMQSRACSCYAEAMVFFGRSPKNAVLFEKEGGRPCAVATGPPSIEVNSTNSFKICPHDPSLKFLAYGSNLCHYELFSLL